MLRVKQKSNRRERKAINEARAGGTRLRKIVPMQSFKIEMQSWRVYYVKKKNHHHHVCQRALLLKLTCRVCDPRDSPFVRLWIYCTDILFVNMTRRVNNVSAWNSPIFLARNWKFFSVFLFVFFWIFFLLSSPPTHSLKTVFSVCLSAKSRVFCSVCLCVCVCVCVSYVPHDNIINEILEFDFSFFSLFIISFFLVTFLTSWLGNSALLEAAHTAQ